MTILAYMDYEHIDGPDGLDIRVPTDEGYRTCSVCGGDCEPDTSLSAVGKAVAATRSEGSRQHKLPLTVTPIMRPARPSKTSVDR